MDTTLPRQSIPGFASPASSRGIEQTCGGRGFVEVQHVSGGSAVTRLQATNPLKLLAPRRSEETAWVYTSSYGGGLVAGDSISIDLKVGDRAAAVLTTQASTKVYRSPDGSGGSRASCQTLHATVADHSLLVIAPDPLQAFYQSDYEQRQTVHLTETSDLVLLDWYTCGRLALGELGERWAMRRLRTRSMIYRNDVCIAEESMHLDAADGPIDAPTRTGKFNCFGTLLLVGPGLATLRDSLVETLRNTPVYPDASLVAAASPLPCGDACVLRFGAVHTSDATRYLATLLAPLSDRLGENLWSRKW